MGKKTGKVYAFDGAAQDFRDALVVYFKGKGIGKAEKRTYSDVAKFLRKIVVNKGATLEKAA
jgi:hypothetical protein